MSNQSSDLHKYIIWKKNLPYLLYTPGNSNLTWVLSNTDTQNIVISSAELTTKTKSVYYHPLRDGNM